MQYPSKDLFKPDDEDMDYIEFCTLLSGIMPETPLGKIISIRAEEDKEVLKHFTTAQHQIRNEWRDFQTKEFVQKMDEEEVMNSIQEMFKNAFT